MIKFYYHFTPNPMKVALFLEETGLPYELIGIDTFKGEQHTPEFLKINPNGKTPAIIDDNGNRVFDSTAILLHLAEQSGKLLGKAQERGELLSWLMFIASGLGPFSGQCVHFRHVAPEKIDYAINRYTFEAKRHYGVLNRHLAGRDFIVGDEYSIADISAWGWIDRAARVLGEGELDKFPNLVTWLSTINSRPAVAKARALDEKLTLKKDVDEEARRALFPSNF